MAGKKTEKPKSGLDASALEGLIGFHIRLALLAMRRSFFQEVGEGNVRPGLSSVVQLLAMNPGASQTELSARLGIDKATLVSLIDTAESSGWITRARATDDRRRHELALTREGRAMARRLGEQTKEHEKKFRARFSDKELEDFIEYLKRIYT